MNQTIKYKQIFFKDTKKTKFKKFEKLKIEKL